MKFRTTQKAIKENYSTIIEVGYCDLQHLLNFKTPMAYTCGGSGWYADIYDIDGVAIVTGYRPFGNINPDYDTCKEYDRKAEELRYKNMDMEGMRIGLEKLITEFIREVQQC